MRRFLTNLAVAGVLAATLAACGAIAEQFTNPKRAPDEFAVYSRPPLSLPPDYALRPPRPGEDDFEDQTAQDLARAALLQSSTSRAGRAGRAVRREQLGDSSPGLIAFLEQTGANQASPDIRNELEIESRFIADEEQHFVDKLIFWVDDLDNPGTIIDAQAEQRRILEQQALGEPLNKGDVPEIVRKPPRKGILGDLF